MTLAQAQARHAQLADELRRHDHAYHVLAKPEVSDGEYSELYAELLELEKQFPMLVTPSSPTQKSSAVRKSEALTAETKRLREEIERHNRLYYQNAVPEISDYEYDLLVRRLEQLERRRESKKPKHRRLVLELPLADSPTQRVGGAASEKFARFNHLVPMLSLDKIEASDHPNKDDEPDRDKRNRAQDENTLAKLLTWDASLRKQLGRDQIEYFVEPKVDGVSISIHYRHGKLALGVTRGDGRTGDDITANLKTLNDIPHELRVKNPPALIEVRGEAYMATKDFEELNARLAAAGEKTLPNARNGTAGSLKQLDPNLVSQRPIRAVFYATGALDGIEFKTHSEMLETLAKFGLPTQKLWWCCKDMDEVLKIYREKIVVHYDEDRDLRRQLPCEIDGVVIKVNTLADWPRIPGRSRAPGYAIVHKPVPWITPAETVLKAITVQVGRTGVLTPVAELEPVFVQGSTVARATLHNEDEIRRKDIRIGDTVVVRKAGMVIPEVFEVVKTKRPADAKEFDLVAHVGGKCPACGGPIAKDKIKSSRSGETAANPPLTPPKRGTDAGNAASGSPPLEGLGVGSPESAESDEVAWRCQNIAGCPAQLMRRVEYFAARKALDIESLGGSVAEKLVERDLVKDPLDLFDLTLDKLGKLNLGTDDEPRTFGEKNATKVLEALERAKTAPLHRWIHALAIMDVGESIAHELAKLHRNLDELAGSKLLRLIADEGKKSGELRAEIEQIVSTNPALKVEAENQRKILEADISKLNVELKGAEESGADTKHKSSLKGRIKTREARLLTVGLSEEIGPVVARSVVEFFSSAEGKSTLERLRNLKIHPAGSVGQATAKTSDLKLVGKTFVLTGSLPTLSRDEASALIREAGGSVTSSVSKNTDYLLTGESAGSKFDKAKELGVPILTEAEFLKLIGKAASSAKSPNQGSLL